MEANIRVNSTKINFKGMEKEFKATVLSMKDNGSAAKWKEQGNSLGQMVKLTKDNTKIIKDTVKVNKSTLTVGYTKVFGLKTKKRKKIKVSEILLLMTKPS